MQNFIDSLPNHPKFFHTFHQLLVSKIKEKINQNLLWVVFCQTINKHCSNYPVDRNSAAFTFEGLSGHVLYLIKL